MKKETKTKKVKTGGRKKGTPNKVTKHLRGQYEDFINQKLPELEKTWDTLEESDKWSILLKMSSFVIPKKIENDFNIDGIAAKLQSMEKINSMFKKN